MAYKNQDKCVECGISIPHVGEGADPDAALCDGCLATMQADPMIRKGDQVTIKRPYRDAGDADYVWVACDDEDEGRVRIMPLGTGLTFPPCHVVNVDMLEKGAP